MRGIEKYHAGMPSEDRLFFLLKGLTDQELQNLWEQGLRCDPVHRAYSGSPRRVRIDLISREWRSAHGHSLFNLMRGPHELPWKRILIDVADQLHAGWGWTAHTMGDGTSEEVVEQHILALFDERMKAMWAKLDEDARAKLAHQIDIELAEQDRMTRQLADRQGTLHVTSASLGAGISAGLMTGAGALVIAQGSMSFIAGGLVGGVLAQLGAWLVVRLFGFWAGVEMAAGGGLAAVGGALASAPAAVAVAANMVMSTSYRKSIPTTLMLLCAHEQRRQLAEMERQGGFA